MWRSSIPRLTGCILSLWLLLSPAGRAYAADITGRVTNAISGVPLEAATIRIEQTGETLVSDHQGEFSVSGLSAGRYNLTASFIGYLPLKTSFEVPGEILLLMQPTILPGEEVLVTTTRASQTMPITHSNITEAEIDRDHMVQDVPMLLASEPGVYAYSDAGHGVGYSYLQIRGFEQRKVGVYLNGVPLNDPASHSVYWIDLPDILESATDIQIQRGVGNSLYGASAPGGVVSVELDPFTVQPRFRLTAGAGSYNTQKFSIEGASGLVDDTYSLYGRFSRQVSDGYREQSWSDVWSYFVGFARYDRDLTNRLYAFGGPEHVHAAWDGIDRTQMKVNRRFNPLTYEKETDTFNQPHYQWVTDWTINDRLSFSNTAFYVKGDGFFIQEKRGRSFADLDLDTTGLGVTEGDVVLQRHVQNDFYGIVPRLQIDHGGGTLTVGGELSRHAGYHFGEVLSVVPAPADFRAGHDYYNYDVRKLGATVFVLENYSPSNGLHLMGALQFQWKRYQQRNDRRKRVNYDVDYSFVTPRLGALYEFTPQLSAYGNVSLAQHEPVSDEIYDPQDFENPADFFGRLSGGVYSDPVMQAEKMTNVEAGLAWRDTDRLVAVNAFYQYLIDEIVPGGGLDEDGEPIRANAGRSVHRGIEAEARWRPGRHLEVAGNVTLSDNYFKEYIEKFDPANPVDYSGHSISSFPDLLGNLSLHADYPLDRKQTVSVLGGASLRHVGRIYLDNSQTDSLSIDPHFVVNLRGGLRFALGGRPIEAELMVNNATNELYSTFGYTWGGAYLWPAAERNYFFRVRAGW